VPPLTATQLLNAWCELDLMRSRMLEEMSEYPVLLCPVASIPAFRHGERKWVIEGQTVEYLDAVRYTEWFNAMGAPAAVVPVGHSPEGLPIGVQIVARPFQDETALGVAAVVDAALAIMRHPSHRRERCGPVKFIHQRMSFPSVLQTERKSCAEVFHLNLLVEASLDRMR
jgi:Asp-tRNA(Asn)/Glu-tRNA(Gln) amidotransferase A subunit family amidase